MSTTPDQPQEPERKPEPSEQEATAARDAAVAEAGRRVGAVLRS